MLRFGGGGRGGGSSRRTFSAAEEFTYNLKNLKRATIVGETTGGGAHRGAYDASRITSASGCRQAARSIRSTKTNWEGAGIAPDIAVDSAVALRAAHLAALERVRASATNVRHRARIEAVIKALKS